MLRHLLRRALPLPVKIVAWELYSVVKPTSTINGEVSDFHRDAIRPEIWKHWRPTVIEIGVLQGSHTRLLLASCLPRLGRLICIDPSPHAQIARVARYHPACRLIKRPSLEALPDLVARGVTADVVIVDGDHNYYTVTRELGLIEQLLSPAGVVFVHDVGWPYGRRDLYYEPDRIPESERHDFAMLGITRGSSGLPQEGGVNRDVWNARHEGGPRNGVLTAIEDFIAQSGEKWTLEIRDEQYGLGILRRA
jgi:Methyltransferase domain